MGLGNVFKTIGEGVTKLANSKHSQTVTGLIAIGGLIGTAVLAYRMRPKMDEVIAEQREKVKAIDEDETLSPEEAKAARKVVTVETVKKVAKVAGPTVSCAAATAGFIGGTVAISNFKIGNLTSLLGMSEIAYQELFDKTKELVGEEKMNEIQGEIAKDNIISRASDGKRQKYADLTDEEIDSLLEVMDVVQAEGGDQMFFDKLTKRIFKSDCSTIRRACNNLSSRCRNTGGEPYVTYRDFYYELGLKNEPPIYELIGWGGYSLRDTEITPNLCNPIILGERSFIVLDWITHPTDKFK